MNKLDKKLKDQMDELSPETFEAYAKARNHKDDIQVGEIVHRGDGSPLLNDAHIGIFSAIHEKNPHGRYVVSGNHWQHIARPYLIPNIKNKWGGGVSPFADGDLLQVWTEQGAYCGMLRDAIDVNFNAVKEHKITHVMLWEKAK